MTEPFPFIVARGRSGTTLLRAMFDSHPDMAVPPESHFVVPMIERRRQLESRGRLSRSAFVADLTGRYGFRRWDLDVRAVELRLRDADPVDLASAIREVFGLYAEQLGKRRYAEKTPINVLHIEALAAVFPEARFIHLIRDGRNVALSYLDTDFGVTSVPEAAIHWRRFVRRGRRAGARIGSHRYREVLYEDLVDQPEPVLRSLCEFIELPFDPSMLLYHTRADELLTNTSHREHHGRIALPPTAGLRDWRRDMEPDAVALFEAIAGDLLEELGYERGEPVISRGTRRAARRARATSMIERTHGRIRRVTHRPGSSRRPLKRPTSREPSHQAAMTSPTDPGRNTGGVT